MKFVYAVFGILLCADFALASHEKLDRVLKKYVSDKNLVAYAQLKHDARDKKHDLLSYLDDLQGTSEAKFNKMDKKEQLAFLINAYNAFTLKLIIDNFPIKSIKDTGSLITSPWKKELFSIFGGKLTTLDGIEHTWIRPKYKDYRIHAAVNCASIGCPVLRQEAYTGAKLDAQLDQQMKVWLADETKNKVAGSKIMISKIFDWYEEDFKPDAAEIVKKYAPKKMQDAAAKGYKIDYMDYDWSLNVQ